MSDVKVNISFPLVEPAVTACEKINRGVVDITPSAVSFGNRGTSSPHVTIAMGGLGREALPALLRATGALVAELPAGVTLSFGQPYRERVTGRYVFCDVFFEPVALAWRVRAQRELQQLFVTPARVSEDPHLTVAHVEQRWEEVDSYLTLCGQLPDCVVPRVDIALSGSKGRKLELLQSIEIG